MSFDRAAVVEGSSARAGRCFRIADDDPAGVADPCARMALYFVANATSSASVPLPAMQSIVADPSAQVP